MTDMAETSAEAGVATAAGRPTLGRFIVDFALALVVFIAAAGLIGTDTGNAFPAPPPPDLVKGALLPVVQPLSIIVPSILPAPDTAGPALVLLAIAFATLAATNLAIGRHLLSAYASPRRRAGRKG